MKIFLSLFLFCYSASFAQELAYISAFGSKIYFEPPDTSAWYSDQNGLTTSGSYHLMVKHTPLKDSLGRNVEPIMSIIVQHVLDSSDVIMYSIEKRGQVPFQVVKVLAYDSAYYSYRNVIGYEGTYTREGILHKIFVIHMRGASVGLQIICDSTDQVYAQVEADFRRFIKSIGIDQ